MDDSTDEPRVPPEDAAPEQSERQVPHDDEVASAVIITVDHDQEHALARRASWASTNWPWVLGLGIVGIVFGLIMLSHAFGTLRGVAWLAGLFLLFMGLVQLLTTSRGGSRGAHIMGAAICIVGGIVLLVWPGETLTVLAWVAGITVLVWGIVRILAGLRERHEGHTWDLWSGIALAVLLLVLGVYPTPLVRLLEHAVSMLP